MSNNGNTIFKYVSLVSQVGLMMAVPIVGFMLLGNYLDRRLGTKFIFLIVFTLLGMVVAFRGLYKLSMKSDPLEDKDENHPKK